MWFMAAGMVMAAVSAAAAAKSQADQGVREQNIANTQATGLNRQAAEAESRAKDIDLQAQQEQQNRMVQMTSAIATNRAVAAASGVSTDSGSFETIEAHNRDIVGQDIANVRYIGGARMRATRRQAGYDKEGAEIMVRAGQEARSAANLRMWGEIVKGASTIASYGAIGSMGGGAAGAGKGMFGAGAGISPNA